MKTTKLFTFGAISAIPFFLFSCISSESSMPLEASSKSEEVVININVPDLENTRADQGYKLRYVAKIFEGESTAAIGAYLQRKEIAGDDLSENNRTNQIVFKVNPNVYYTIMVFADYIPADYAFKDDTDNAYGDYFYDTDVKVGVTSITKNVNMRPTPGLNSDDISADFFNNDNYDCFFASVSFQKTEEEKVVDLTLKRALARVELRDISTVTGDYQLKVNKLGYRPGFAMDTKIVTDQTANAALSLSGTQNTAGEDILYFYVFANDNESNQYASIDFSVTTPAGETQNFSISKIPVKKNYKTVVRGSYLEPQQPEDDPSGGSSTKVGDIILNLSTDQDWTDSFDYSMSRL